MLCVWDMINAVSVDALMPNYTFDHGQAHSICMFNITIHPHDVLARLPSVLCTWEVTNLVSADGLAQDCIRPTADATWNLYFVS